MSRLLLLGGLVFVTWLSSVTYYILARRHETEARKLLEEARQANAEQEALRTFDEHRARLQ